jgi:hypothetical protein
MIDCDGNMVANLAVCSVWLVAEVAGLKSYGGILAYWLLASLPKSLLKFCLLAISHHGY